MSPLALSVCVDGGFGNGLMSLLKGVRFVLLMSATMRAEIKSPPGAEGKADSIKCAMKDILLSFLPLSYHEERHPKRMVLENKTACGN